MNKGLFNDKKVALTEDNQKESKLYLEEIEKIENLKTQLLIKKRNADGEIDKLNEKLARLDKEYLFETDPLKIKELAEKKKDIRYEIEEYQSIKNTKYNAMVKDMLKETDQYRSKAEKELAEYTSYLYKKEEEYRTDLKNYEKEIYKKIEELNHLGLTHLCVKANTKYYSIIMDKSDW